MQNTATKPDLRVLVIVIMSLCGSAYAQTKDPRQFSGWNRNIIFEDNFSDDRNKWLSRDDTLPATKKAEVEAESSIAEGFLNYELIKGDKPYALAIEQDIDYSRNFEIEYCFKITASAKKNETASAFFWGRDTGSSACFLYFTKVGGANFVNCIDPDWKKCSWKHSFSFPFNKNTFNRIYLRKVRDNYYLFVNERLEKTYPYQPLRGNKIGLGAGVGASVSYDYIKISYIE